MLNEQIKKRAIRKKVIIRFIIFIFYFGILLLSFYIFIEFREHPLITIALIVFIFLVTIGPFLRRNRKSLYSRMFSNSKNKQNSSYQKEIVNPDEEYKWQTQQKIHKPINLNTNYRKPLINKCENCGNIVPSFVKTCPFCRNQLK